MKINRSIICANTKQNKKLKIGIIFSLFNSSIGNKLLESTVENLIKLGVTEKNINVFNVPGALEIPLAAQKITEKKYDAIIALGIVIKGDTYHFEIVSDESHRALMDISLKRKIPVVFGIICAYSEKQARDRTDAKKMDKGREFAETAVEMANFVKKM